MDFHVNTLEYYDKITRCDPGKGGEYGYVF